MAFCAITKTDYLNLLAVVTSKLNKDITALQDFRKFSREFFTFLVSKGADTERAVALAKELPALISHYRTSSIEKRAAFRKNKISVDRIDEEEDTHFRDFEKLSVYLGLKEEKPIVVVSQQQADASEKVDNLIKNTKKSIGSQYVPEKAEYVEFRIINEDNYPYRVTSVATAGYKYTGGVSPALKHGTAIDALAKDIFDGKDVKYEDHKAGMTETAFQAAYAGLKAHKERLEKEGFVFRTGVLVYDKATGLSGEIDLLLIDKKGKAHIYDFKTKRDRFNRGNLEKASFIKYNEESGEKEEVSSLPHDVQYTTQGTLYGMLLHKQTGIEVDPSVSLIGIELDYPTHVPAEESTIEKVYDLPVLTYSPVQKMRAEYKGKSLEEIVAEHKKLSAENLGTPVQKARREVRTGRKRENLERIAIIDEVAATDSQLKEEVEWLKANPIGKHLLIQMDDTVNSGLFGKTNLESVTLYKNASRGTGYHEGWHVFTQLFLSRKQKKSLYDTVAGEKIIFTSRDGRKLNTATASHLDIEEFLADEFAKYALSPDTYIFPKGSPVPKNIFQKIWEFLLRYFGSNHRPFTLFQKLYRGEINSYTPARTNAFWGTLNSMAVNGQGEEIVSNDRLPLYIRTFDALVAKELRQAKRSFSALSQSRSLQKKVFNNVFLELENKFNTDIGTLTDEQYEELSAILDESNAHAFTNLYLQHTAYDTIKGTVVEEEVFSSSYDELVSLEEVLDESADLEEYDEEEKEYRKEKFDRPGNEDAALALADKSVQDFFRSIPKIKGMQDGLPVYELNELGFTENHKYYDIFYQTKKFLKGVMDVEEVMSVLNNPDNQRLFPELKNVAEYLDQFLDNKEGSNTKRLQNFAFVQSFINVMSMPEITNTQLTLNYRAQTKKKGQATLKNTTVDYRKASRNLSLKIIKTWEQKFKDTRGKSYFSVRDMADQQGALLTYPLLLTSEGKLLLNPFIDYKGLYSRNDWKSLRSFFEMIGVTLNDKVFEDGASVKRLEDIFDDLTANIDALYGKLMVEGILLFQVKAMEAGIPIDEEADLITLSETMPLKMVEDVFRQIFIDNPVRDFSKVIVADEKEGIKTTSMRTSWEDLAEIEEKFGELVSSGSFRIENKTKYPYYIPSQISLVTGMLNKVNSLDDLSQNIYLSHLDPAKHPWMKRSYFLQQMFDPHSRARKTDPNRPTPVSIVLEDIASIKVINKNGKVVEKHPRNLNRREKFLVDVLTMFHSGAIEIPRSETSSTIFSLRLSSYGAINNELRKRPLNDTSYGTLSAPFFTILKNYLLAEVEKRQWYQKNQTKSAFAGKFNVFEDMISPELKAKLVEHLGLSPEEILTQPFTEGDTIEAVFRKEMTDYFARIIKDVKTSMDKFSPEQKELIKDSLQDTQDFNAYKYATLFTVNQFVQSVEFYNIYFGDLYFYKNPFKRGKVVTNTGTPMYVDNYRNEQLNDLHQETLHSIVTGEKKVKDFRHIKSGTLADVKINSSYVSDRREDNRLFQDMRKVQEFAGAISPAQPDYAEQLDKLFHKTQKYKGMNIADGQGIISLDFYKTFALVAAPHLWTDSKEKEYQRQKAIFRYNNDLYFTLDDKGRKVQMEGDELRQARKKDADLKKSKPFDYFNPMKISYTGPQVSDGPFKPVFDKFSVRPILPETAVGRRDEEMLWEMASKDYDYIKFESGSKIIQKEDPKTQWFKKIADGTYDLNHYEVSLDNSQPLYSAYLKHQLNTEGFKEENIFGSQFRKILFSVKYLPHVLNNPTLSAHFKSLEDRFMKTIKDLLEVEENDLFTTLGVDRKPNGSYYVKNMERFLTLINEESAKRGIPINNINYIQYNRSAGEAKYPIDYAFNRAQITDLLAGMIDDRLRRLKVNGANFIQVSHAGYENKTNTAPASRYRNPTQQQKEQYGTAGLHYYHVNYEGNTPVRTSTMGIKVALGKEYEKLFKLEAPLSLKGGPIGVEGDYEASLARLNEAMKDREWKEKNLQQFILVGYRIPTGNNNFLDNMEIMEFLPKSAGNIIIAPYELIIKSGSDFDIDKMNIIKPTFTESGRMVTLPKESIAEITKNIREATVLEKDVKNAQSELREIMSETDVSGQKLAKLQRKVRATIADLLQESRLSEGLVETIFMNIKKGEKEVIPTGDQVLLEEDAFSDLKEEFNPSLLDKNLQKFFTIDREITRLWEKHITAKEAKENSKVDMTWFNKKKQYKNAKNNDIVSITHELLSHPYYFELLVTPSTAEDMESIANDLIASQNNYTEDEKKAKMTDKDGGIQPLYDTVNTPARNLRYTTSLQVFDNFLNKAKDLGGYAIQRPFSDLLNHIQFTINKNYTTSKGEKVVYTPLLSLSDRAKLIKDGRITMHGPYTKDVFDQLISATVDLASSPFYAHMGINIHNKKILQYLVHQQTDPKVAFWFLNQPILKELYDLVDDQKNKVFGYTLKHGIVEIATKYGWLHNKELFPGMQEYEVFEKKLVLGNEFSDDPVLARNHYEPVPDQANPMLKRPYLDLNSNLNEADLMTFSDLDQAIRADGKNRKEGKRVSFRNDALQKLVFSYFASTIEESDMFLKLQFAYNTDTTKYSTLTSIIRNNENKRVVKQSDFFNLSQIEKLENDSMISPFDYTKKAYSIYRNLFPYLYTDYTVPTFTSLALDVFGVTNIDLERVSKIIENDYIEFVYKNFGEYRGRNISQYFEPLLRNLSNSSGHRYFTDEFFELLEKYPELKGVPFVSRIYEERYIPAIEDKYPDSFRNLDNTETRNLFFLRHPDNPTAERDIYTRNWSNLIHFQPRKLGLSGSYTYDQVQEISTFFDKMVYFSLYQSGLTNNSNGFSDLIPYEHWGSFVEDAFSRMEENVKRNANLGPALMNVFQRRIMEMNPKINFSSAYDVVERMKDGKPVFRPDGKPKTDQIPYQRYANYYRGKDYLTDDRQIGFNSGIPWFEVKEEKKEPKTMSPKKDKEDDPDVCKTSS